MWHERLTYLIDRPKWILGSGALATLLGAVWFLSAWASPAVPRHTPLPVGDLRGAEKPNPIPAGRPTQPLALIAPQAFEQLSPDQAAAANDRVAISRLPNPAAKPFKLVGASPVDRARAQACLTMAVYYEAGNQGPDGEAAVAQVVLNRVRHPLFPKTVCGVVFQGAELPTGCQFTFSCDGSLGRRPSIAGWKQASQIAERALDGYVQKDVGEATHYHTVWVVPYWQASVVKLAKIGAHIFYRWPGGMGTPSAFQGQYAGAETSPPTIAGFDLGLNPVLTAVVDTKPPTPASAAAAPAPIIAPRHPVQLAMLTSDAAPVLSGPIEPPPAKPAGFFGDRTGGQHLPVPARW